VRHRFDHDALKQRFLLWSASYSSDVDRGRRRPPSLHRTTTPTIKGAVTKGAETRSMIVETPRAASYRRAPIATPLVARWPPPLARNVASSNRSMPFRFKARQTAWALWPAASAGRWLATGSRGATSPSRSGLTNPDRLRRGIAELRWLVRGCSALHMRRCGWGFAQQPLGIESCEQLRRGHRPQGIGRPDGEKCGSVLGIEQIGVHERIFDCLGRG